MDCFAIFRGPRTIGILIAAAATLIAPVVLAETYLTIENVPVDKSALVNAQDPVCGMAVETRAANCQSEYKGKTFYFCCSGCKQTFDKQPEVYA